MSAYLGNIFGGFCNFCGSGSPHGDVYGPVLNPHPYQYPPSHLDGNRCPGCGRCRGIGNYLLGAILTGILTLGSGALAADAVLTTEPVAITAESLGVLPAAVVEEISKTIKTGNLGPIEVRTIGGPNDTATGVQFAAKLAEELGKLKTSGGAEPAFLAGTWQLTDDGERGFTPHASLILRSARTNKKLAELEASVATGTPTAKAAELLGATVSLGKNDTKAERVATLRKRLQSPKTYIDNNLVMASATDSNVGVEIRIENSDGKSVPVKPVDLDGKAFVEIPKGSTYVIVLHNKSKAETACSISIDGFSVFEFSEVRSADQPDSPRYNYYVIPGESSQVIPGWHIRDEGDNNYAEFTTTELGQGASRLKSHQSSSAIGQIAVSAHPTANAGQTRSGAGVETGLGRGRTTAVEPTSREVLPATEVITVRYVRD